MIYIYIYIHITKCIYIYIYMYMHVTYVYLFTSISFKPDLLSLFQPACEISGILQFFRHFTLQEHAFLRAPLFTGLADSGFGCARVRSRRLPALGPQRFAFWFKELECEVLYGIRACLNQQP